MGREAKMGLMFIGILLTVFSALVIKRLTKHPNLPPLDLNAMSVKAADGTALTHLPPQPPPPTLVTPKDENSRPPEFANIRDGQNYDSPRQNAGSLWERPATHPLKTEIAANDAPPAANPPPSLLAEPLPVADAGSRYTAPHVDTPSHADTPLPYRSGYNAASDDASSNPAATARQTQTEPPVDPFPRVAETPPRAGYTTAAEPPHSSWQGNPSAAIGATETANPPVNGLRPIPGTTTAAASAGPYSTGISSGSDRYSPPTAPPPQASSQIPLASSDFTPHATPTNEYLPRNHASSEFSSEATTAGDFTSRPGFSAVVPASAVPVGIQREGDQYTVHPNDSFWIISEKAYGAGGYFKALFELNRKRTKDSEDLKVGEVLTVPDEAVLRRMYPDLCPKPRKQVASLQQRMVSANSRLQGAGHVYTVVDGDTLFEIARHELGKPSRWGEIYELNRDALGDDFDYLRPGTELILPDRSGGSSDLHGNTATRQPDSVYPR